MSESIVNVTSLEKTFVKNRVLSGVDLHIERGTVVGLVGTNGAGKSTLIKCMLGLLRPTSGGAYVFGEEAWDLSEANKARLSYVPQDIKLYPWMKVRHVIDYTSAFYENWDRSWVDQLVSRWQLPAGDLVRTLSTGQAQKLALVLAMGHRPELMVLDEPVASLDPVGRREFLRAILELTSSHERTILFSTHITSDLERIASHVAILRQGRVVFYDELDALKDRFKRLRVRALETLPDDFAVDGALRMERNGATAMVVVPDVSESTVRDIRSRWNADVSVEDLNLEEIFVELHDA